MIIDELVTGKLINKADTTIRYQVKESIREHIVAMLEKNSVANLTVNLNFTVDGRDIFVKGDAMASSQEKHKNKLTEFIVNDEPDFFYKTTEEG